MIPRLDLSVVAASRRLHASLLANPVAWLLLALLALAECGNYRNGRDLERLCELTGAHDISVPERYALTPAQKIDNICAAHQAADD